MSAADLIALGCPPLPPGRFYRVGGNIWSSYSVQIREDRRYRWLGSRLIQFDHVSRFENYDTGERYDEPISLEEAIVVAAKRAHRDYAAKLDKRRWEGDHR